MALYSLIALQLFLYLNLILFNAKISGFYIALAIITIVELLKYDFIMIVAKKIVIIFLLSNLISTSLNIIFYYLVGVNQFATIMLQSDEVNNVVRSVSLLGFELIIVRPYGVLNNIHITALLNLILYVHFFNINKYAGLRKAIFLIIIISYNLQTIIMLFLFINFYKINKINKIMVLKNIALMLFLFGIFDYFFMDSAYNDQITKTFDSDIIYEAEFYISTLNPVNLLFGIDLLNVDDPFDGSYYSIPVIDIGFFNIFMQYGVIGVMCIIIFYKYLYDLLDVNGKKFMIVNLFSLIHYFNIISFACLISTYFIFSKKINQSISNEKKSF